MLVVMIHWAPIVALATLDSVGMVKTAQVICYTLGSSVSDILELKAYNTTNLSEIKQKTYLCLLVTFSCGLVCLNISAQKGNVRLLLPHKFDVCISDINECADSSADCTLSNLRCINAVGSYACACEQGFLWNGDTCVCKCK